MAITIKKGGQAMYGKAKVASKNGKVIIKIWQKDNEHSTKGNEVWLEPVTVKMTPDNFFKAMPNKKITAVSPDRYFFIALPKTANGEEAETLYQFRPWMDEEAYVKFKGFAKNDKGEFRLTESFNEKKQLQVSAEFVVSRGDWVGAVYPYRYWNVTDKSGNPIFNIEDHNLNCEWMPQPMVSLLELSGLLERQPTCKLADTDDPQVVLDWLEKELKRDDREYLVAIANGYPIMAGLHLAEVDDDFEDDGDDKDEEVTDGKDANDFDED